MTTADAFALVQLGVDDYPEILDLWQRAGLHIRPQGRDTPAALARQLATGVQAVLGLRLNRAVEGEGGAHPAALVAVVVATHDSRKGWINRLAVDPAYRRRGLARRLIRACEEHFQRIGIEVWAAQIEGWNTASVATFAEAGYVVHDDIIYVSRRVHEGA